MGSAFLCGVFYFFCLLSSFLSFFLVAYSFAAEPPTPELLAAVLKLYTERVHDARFIIPMLSGLSKDVLFQHLPHLVALPRAPMKLALTKLIHGKPVRGERVLLCGGNRYEPALVPQSPLKPVELMVKLHDMQTESIDPSIGCSLQHLVFGTAGGSAAFVY